MQWCKTNYEVEFKSKTRQEKKSTGVYAVGMKKHRKITRLSLKANWNKKKYVCVYSCDEKALKKNIYYYIIIIICG